MNKHELALYLLLAGVSAGALAQEEEMTLQQERDRMGAEMEENRQQIGRDINRIREPNGPPADAEGIDRGGVPSDAVPPRPRAPGTANPPAGTSRPGGDDVRQPTSGPGADPVPVMPGGANGNVSPGSGVSPGGIGTDDGNGAAAGSSSGGAATGGPMGGAADQP
ncbi:hypothetical protein BAY1663_01754 [Pseudomonas sp. BAY1663]|uniref:hypothetical protein n=1 Tax=Pseudomonas sp. BAY1663 TaxID=1439940 RepID=UPI00042E0167|nr:hypothetical protein [Pseudomonas sp. BAY1663]EXF45817.1 hypothetical protein BAY1663_01754 [Pseudomonas sp. BAY1663]